MVSHCKREKCGLRKYLISPLVQWVVGRLTLDLHSHNQLAVTLPQKLIRLPLSAIGFPLVQRKQIECGFFLIPWRWIKKSERRSPVVSGLASSIACLSPKVVIWIIFHAPREAKKWLHVCISRTCPVRGKAKETLCKYFCIWYLAQVGPSAAAAEAMQHHQRWSFNYLQFYNTIKIARQRRGGREKPPTIWLQTEAEHLSAKVHSPLNGWWSAYGDSIIYGSKLGVMIFYQVKDLASWK